MIGGGSVVLGLLLWLVAPQAATTATIEGTVVTAGSNEHASGIRVTLTKPQETATPESLALARLRPPAPIPSATTDADGKFQLKGIEPGKYRLTFAANGYVRQDYGQKIFPGQGTLIELAAGQSMKDLKIRMTSTAAISGRVWDSNKQPIAAVPVHLMRFTYDASGRRNLLPVASTQTDDRGDYRLYGLTPGRYYLAAGMMREALAVRPFNGVMESYAVTYYPGFSEIGRAAPIEIKPSVELTIDIPMMSQNLYRIRGKVTDARLGQPPTSLIVALTTTGGAISSSYEVRGESLTYNSADGSFEVRGVLPGTYLLTVTWGDSVTLSNKALATLGVAAPTPGRPPAERDSSMSAFNIVREGIAYATLNVGNADVENIALTLVAGGSVAGRLRMDGAGDASSQSLAPNLKVQLNTSLNGVPANIPGIFRPRPGDVSGDGAFTIPNVRVGEYRVSVDGMPSGYYLKEARIGPNDVLNRPFQFTAGGADQNTIEIVLGTGAPSVSGTATNERLDAIPGALVVLVPERLRDRLDLYKTATADANGRFTISSVAPGDYKIFAWEALEPNAFFDPELLKQVDSRGKSVHLGELSAPTADVRVIPAESPF